MGGACSSAGRHTSDPTDEVPRSKAADDISALLALHADALAQLRALVEPLPDFDTARHDDVFLLRFLLSHKLQPKAAARAFGNALTWRRANGVEEIAAAIRGGMRQEAFPHFEKIHPLVPLHLVIGDKEPIIFISLHELRLAELMQTVSSADYVQYTHHMNELTFQAADRVTRRTGRLAKLVRLLDARTLGWRHFNLRYFSAVAAAARGSEDAYPQMLGGFYLCNLGPTMHAFWRGTIKPLLPTRFVEKTFLYEPATHPEDLAALLAALSKECVPVQLGGTLQIGMTSNSL